MEWNTIYIKGKANFRSEVRKRLEDSDVNFMPGFIEGANGRSDLYWIGEQTSVQDIKEAVGAKLIWKYRLRFFDTLESFLEEKNEVKRKRYEVGV